MSEVSEFPTQTTEGSPAFIVGRAALERVFPGRNACRTCGKCFHGAKARRQHERLQHGGGRR